MNPFHFVPLPPDGPQALPPDIFGEPRYEGCIEYSIEVKTALHITGKTTRNGNHFDKKYFYENYGQKVIPGSSVRGMLAAFIEAVTGSDLRIFNRGDEEASGRRLYGKHYDEANAKNCRHVGFLLAAPNHRLPEKTQTDTYIHAGTSKTRQFHECHDTLPPSFGMDTVEDAARFLFGYVNARSEENRPAAGRLFFEDILVPQNTTLVPKPAWDLNSRAIMGGPNPRANTAWYFTPGTPRHRPAYNVWEIIADKIRGRKFYFHQDPMRCYEAYRRWTEWVLMPRSNKTAMVEYNVQAIDSGQVIPNGRIYFVDMPYSLLSLVAWAIALDNDMAHKLGGLKPFGFGSVKLQITGLTFRPVGNPFASVQSGLKGRVDGRLLYNAAYLKLQRILHWPSAVEMPQFLFSYPPFRPNGTTSAEKGFAQLANEPMGCPPTPASSRKLTMFFDQYQQNAGNYPVVSGGTTL